jgi:hypothetical protein
MPTARLLLVGAPNTPISNLLEDLTGSAPAPNVLGSLAGTTHEWNVKTAYYNANVPVWIDEISNIEEWKLEFLKPEAKEVVQAVGAWVYCFRLSSPLMQRDGGDAEYTAEYRVEKTMQAIQAVAEEHKGYGEMNVMLAVALPLEGKDAQILVGKEKREEMDDLCMQYGFEFVEYAAKGMNEFGEKQGFERLKEALHTNEWSGTGDEDDDDELTFDSDNEPSVSGFGHEEAEMTAELFGLKASLLGNDDDEDDAETLATDLAHDRLAEQVDGLDYMMSKLLAVREQSVDLPEAQRRKVAARAVNELMSEGLGPIKATGAID